MSPGGRRAAGSGQVRVTGGTHRGRRLAVLPGVRPTEGRVREALFSIWQSRLLGARLLDLFAGSGVVSVEALGRGAHEVVLVEGERRIAARLRGQLEALGLEGWRLLGLRLPDGLARLAPLGPFDLAFADPPYAFAGYDALLAGVAPLLAADGELALERRAGGGGVGEAAAAALLQLVDTRDYGDARLELYRHRS